MVKCLEFFNSHSAQQNCVCFERIYQRSPFEYKVFVLHRRNKINIFLKILQKYYRLPTLGILNMSGYFYQNNNAKKLQKLDRNFDVYLHAKKSTSSLTSFMRYYKEIANLLFWKFWECLSIRIKKHCINLKETFMLICMQKVNFIPHFFLDIFQTNRTCY